MTPITITEALQEIKTINKRIEKKRQAISQFVARDARVRDPLEKDGGSEKFIAQERQATSDLENRIVAIRTAIQRSNLDAKLTVCGRTKSVAEWLTWRREISSGNTMFLRSLAAGVAQIRTQIQSKGGKVMGAAVAVAEMPGPADPPHVLVNFDERALIEEQETMEQILGDLDGKLSLYNATALIEA